MKILNSGGEDYHVHSINFSDGFNTIDEIVQYAPKIGLKKIAFTDHSQAALDKGNIAKKSVRGIFSFGRWQNVHNDVEIVIGVEADLLNKEGDICNHIQSLVPDFVILSVHKRIYEGKGEELNEAYENAIKRYGKKIAFLAHPCNKYRAPYLDIDRLTQFANEYNIPMEFDCANFVNNKTDLNMLQKMFSQVNEIYVNSDGHTLHELTICRQAGFDYLKELNLIDKNKDYGRG